MDVPDFSPYQVPKGTPLLLAFGNTVLRMRTPGAASETAVGLQFEKAGAVSSDAAAPTTIRFFSPVKDAG